MPETTRRTSGRIRLTAAQRRAVIEQAATELFAEHGYQRTGMDDIARRAGVSAPVVYDHFPSKRELHRHLLELHFAELQQIWRSASAQPLPPEQRMTTALHAWFGYVRDHPYAWRMLFRDTTGDPAVQALHRQVTDASRAAMLPLLARDLPGHIPDVDDTHSLDMAWEVLRAGLQGLALWWHEHQHVQREQVVAMAMNTLWIGYQRLLQGDTWQQTEPDRP
ncbi:MAG TPA: TetR/AcrR family transcriptional regulator [Pseudonocardiaceae bacterium]